MTNGLLSIVRGGEVFIKIVVGCNGKNLDFVKDVIRSYPIDSFTLDEIYEIALKNNFGCIDCLVVQNKERIIFKGSEDVELPEWYKIKFTDPCFNPRWKYGTAECTDILKVE